MKLMISLVALVPLFWFLGNRSALQAWAAKHKRGIRTGVTWFCGVVLAADLLSQLAIARHDQIFHDEATIVSVSAAFLHGQQMYPLQSAPVEYALLYGPATYLAYVPPVLLHSMHLGVFLVWVAVGFALTLVTLGLTLRKALGRTVALCGMVLLAAFAAPCLSNEWAVRGDVWILLCAALGLWAAGLRNRWAAAACIAVLGAVLTDLKVPLLLVGLLPCVAMWEQDRASRLPAVLAAACMPLLALLPFASRSISLAGYREQLAEASHHGLSLHTFSHNLPYLLYFLLPTLGLVWVALDYKAFATREWAARHRWYLLALTLALMSTVVTGSKFGAGPWHMMAVVVPLVAVDAKLFAMVWASARKDDGSYLRVLSVPLAIAVVMVGTLALFVHRGRQVRLVGPTISAQFPMPAVEQEFAGILRKHDHEDMAMGYTDMERYNLAAVRPLLQIEGEPLFIDAVARNEAHLTNEPLQPGVMEALQACRTKLWVLPAEGEPFSLESHYFFSGGTTVRRLYPQEFTDEFLAHYHQVESYKYFAVWACNGG